MITRKIRKTAPINTSHIGLLILLVLMYLIIMMFRGIYLNILLGIVLAVFLRPLHVKMTKLLFNKKKGGAVLTLLLTLVLILLPLFFLLQLLATEAINIGKSSNGSIAVWQNSIDDLVNKANLMIGERTGQVDLVQKEDVFSFIQERATSIGQRLLGVLGNLVNIIAGSVILFMTIYYVLIDWDELKKWIYNNSPLSKKATEKLTVRGLAVVRAALRGNIVMIFIQAFAGGLGLWLFGIKSPVLLGALYGLSSLVPTIGTGIVWIPSVIYLILIGNYIGAIGLALWNMAVVGSLDNFIMPALVKKGASLHPFLVLTGVLGGLSTFGLVGFIIGPTIIAIALVFIELLKEDTLINNKLHGL